MNLLNIRNLNTVISYLLVVIVRGQIAANGLCLLRAGFRSRVLPHVAKRNIKTKLQIYTSPQHVINTLLWPVPLVRPIIYSFTSESLYIY